MARRMPDLNNEVMMTVDELLEDFEGRWDTGDPPDVFAAVSRCPTPELAETAAEIIQIDIERRWRSNSSQLVRTLTHYLEILTDVFDASQLAELMAWEYRIRQQWGDCVSRASFLQSYQHYGIDVLTVIDSAANDIAWPEITVSVNGQNAVRTLFDREITAGRQRSSAERPWSVQTSPLWRHLVLTERHDASLSRQQLRLYRSAPQKVTLENISRNRALSVEGYSPIDAGASLECRIPVAVHLGQQRFLRVH